MDHTSEKTAALELEPKESYWIAAWKTGAGVLFGREGKIFLVFAGIFLFAYYLPLGNAKVQEAILEGFKMLQAYARNHTLTCVVPALFIAGAIITFLSQANLTLSAVTAQVEADKCASCLICVRSCPYGVPRINADGVSEIDEALCHGCGICCAECPAKAIQLNWYEDDQILCKVEALLEGVI